MHSNGNGNGSLVRRIAQRDETGKVIGVKALTYYADLIEAIHKTGLKAVKTELIQLPTRENGNLAVVKAVVLAGIGRFTAYGDASPVSVTKEFVPHLIRVAETRAKARAIRDALGIGIVAAEELLEAEGIEVEEVREAESDATPVSETPKNNDKPMSEGQRRTLFRLLHSRGIEGEKAHNFLKERFQTENLKEVSSEAAGTVIEELKSGNGQFGEAGEASHA